VPCISACQVISAGYFGYFAPPYMRQWCAVIVVLLVYWLVPGHCLTFAEAQNVRFCYFADMDQLSAEQQETLRKSSIEHLREMVGQTSDVDDDELETMDRVDLLVLMAKSMIAKRGDVQGAVGGSAVIESEEKDRAREVELQLALKRMEMEAENERRRMELEDAKSWREHEWHMAQINRPDRYQGDDGLGENGGMVETGVLDMHGSTRRQSRADTLVNQVKRYGIALKQVVTSMPSDASEVPQFFENLEAMFRVFEVPEDLQAKLLLPFL